MAERTHTNARATLVLAALCVAVLAGSACQSAPKTPEERQRYTERKYQDGMKELERGRPDDAVDAFREAVKYRPDYADARFELGRLLFQKGESLDLQADRRGEDARALEGQGEAVQARDAFGESDSLRLQAQSLYDEAMRNLTFYDDLEPGKPEVAYMAGAIHLSRQEYEEALEYFSTGYGSEQTSMRWKREFEKAIRICQEQLRR